MENVMQTGAESQRQDPGYNPAQLVLGIPFTEKEEVRRRAQHERALRTLREEERFMQAYGPQSGLYQGRFVGYGREEF